MRDLISAGDVRTRAQAAQEVLRVLVRTELAEAEAAAVEDLKGVVLDALLWLVR